MIVYTATKETFNNDVLSNDIENIILEQYKDKLGRSTSRSEISSWRNSMDYMYKVMIDNEIPEDAIVSIEFQIPLTSKRIDFIITGQNERQEEQAIIIELKQWSEANKTEKDGIVETRFRGGLAETAHPSYQAWSYVAMIEGFNQTVSEENISLTPCAYLHNYESDGVIDHEFYQDYIDKAPIFLKSDALKLRDFIKRFIKYGDHKNVIYRIDKGKLKPSKQLADSVASMLKGNQEFILIDDQKVVYETAKALAAKASASNKNVLIVEGGPGTGKSLVAINLLADLTKMGLVTQYVSKNAAPRAVYEAKLTGVKTRTEISNLFKGSGAFIDCEENTFDALIVDEAHRLNYKSGLYSNLGENQILEIISASKFTVFFVDDAQQIHIKDIGDVASIENWALQKGAKVTHMALKSQFRCNGSDGYLAWLDNILGIRETANYDFSPEDFDFKIFDNPNELRTAIEEKNQIYNKSRMVAGYCWDWITKKKDPNGYDVVIPQYGFKMRWNLTTDGSTWIIAPDSINEIGCIHTCQGLEVDYIGVIIGLDLQYDGEKIVTDVLQRSTNDRSVFGIKKMLKEKPEDAKSLAGKIIRNTYRTLMTRGLKGCYIYCEDKSLKSYFKSHLS